MKYELTPNDGRKSFYGKAIVTEYGKNLIVLKSYDTEVCRIENGKFVRMWDGYSATTMKHINSFINQYGIDGGGKKWWINLPVDNQNIIVSIIKKTA